MEIIALLVMIMFPQCATEDSELCYFIGTSDTPYSYDLIVSGPMKDPGPDILISITLPD